MKVATRYSFGIGSGTSPMRLCAAVLAESEEQAVASLKAAIEGLGRELGAGDPWNSADSPSIQHLTVHLNPDNISAADIEEVIEHWDESCPQCGRALDGTDGTCENCAGTPAVQ
jgi:hypothetical protein